LINNRQGGRRRGRGGGGRAPNMNPNAGNRQDNRQRGNAAQLLEKYKGMARDAQMQGDRVQSEYYLQFADHYYRILNENRARYEEQRRLQGGYDAGDEDEDQDELEAASPPDREPQGYAEPREADTREAEDRREPRRQGNGEYRSRRPRRDEEEYGDEGERIAADSLPPAIAIAGEEAEEEPRAPRRRPRRPRDAGEEIAPAA
jgi:uncharacterized protein DUF4167